MPFKRNPLLKGAGFVGVAVLVAVAVQTLPFAGDRVTESSPPPRPTEPLATAPAGSDPNAATVTQPVPPTVVAQSRPRASRPIYGVTVDDVSNLSGIIASLSALPKKPTTRIVFDEDQPPGAYTAAIRAIHPHSYILGEVLDSYYVKTLTTEQYRARVQQYVDAFGDTVDYWEIGNEVNGEWLGTSADVTAKLGAAYDVVKGKGLKVALTLYYNHDCWEKPDHEMFVWTAANVPARLKAGTDLLLMSYYEVDCNNYRPTDWNPVFNRLAALFPASDLGFGEIGLANPAGAGDLVRAQEIARYYYSLKVSTPRYVGGYFWWYFAEDAVPTTKPLFTTIRDLVATT